MWHDDWIVNVNSGSDFPAKHAQSLFFTPLYCIWHRDLYCGRVLCRRSDVSVVLWSQVEKHLASCAVNPRLLWGDASPTSSMITALPTIRPPTTRWVHRHTSDTTRGECRSLSVVHSHTQSWCNALSQHEPYLLNARSWCYCQKFISTFYSVGKIFCIFNIFAIHQQWKHVGFFFLSSFFINPRRPRQPPAGKITIVLKCIITF